MKGLRTILCFLGILTISFFFPVSVQAAPVGKFTFLSGRVDITSPGQAARPVQLNDDVAVGDIVRAKSRSRAEITFVDGNILRLAQNTRVEITEYMVGQEETRGSLHLYRGKIQSVVKTVLGRIFGREKRNRYEVRTPTAVCGVRGTNFFTWHTKAGSGAAFKEGQGYAYSAGRPEDMRYLSAGQAMLVVSPFEPPLIRPATPFELEQHFDDTRPEKSAKADEPPPVMEEIPVPVDTDEAKRLMREPDPAGDAKTSLQKTEEETGRTDAETSVSEDQKLKKTAEALSQIAPEPVAPEEPPPADAIPFTGTFSLTGLDDGILSGYIEKTASYPEDDQGSGKVKIRGVYSDPVPGAKTGPLEGTMDDGSAFQGYLGTLISSTRGDFSSLYVHEGGGAGYLYGHFSGSLVSQTLSASGEAHRTSALGQVAFQAGDGETLSEALGRNLVRDEDTHLYDTCGDYYRLPVPGSINAGGGFDSEQLDPTVRVAELTLENPSTGATGHKIGVFAVSTSGGRYSNQPGATEWFALYGEKGPGSPYYILGAIHGTDDLQGHVDLEVSQPLTYMDTSYLGSLSLWYRGMYSMPEESQSIENLPYQSAGVGLFDLNPLAFAGHWGMGTALCSEGSLYYNDGGTLGFAGNDRGLMGGLTSPWNHDAAPLFAMGEYSDSGPGGTYLWNTPVEGWDPEEPNRALVGFSAGFWKNNLQEDGSANYGTMRGALLSMYKDSGGSAGYLMGPDLSGLFYPDLGMWSVSGAWDRQGKGAVPSLADFDTQQMSGNLAGHFENQGSVLGCGTGETLFLTSAGGYTAPWGLYDFKLGEGNTFSGKPETDAAWSAVAGGSAAFDPDNDGYWLAHVDGTWTAAGEITGDIAGTYLTDSHLGNIKGPFWGINTVLDEGGGGSSGTWIGQSIGTFEGSPLAFGGEVQGSFLSEDEGSLLEKGEIRGLMGGTDDPEAGNAKFIAMGSFSGNGDGSLFAAEIEGHFADTRPYVGYFGGLWSEDTIEYGKVYGLYIGSTGYLQGEFTGNTYADLNLWEVKEGDGILVASQDLCGDAVGATIQDGGLAGKIHSMAGDFIPSADDDGWGIWLGNLDGTYEKLPEETWTSKVAGKQDGDMGPTYFSGELSGSAWSEGRFEAGLSNFSYMNAQSMGTAQGTLIGAYEEGTWKGVSLFRIQTEPLSFGSILEGKTFGLTPGKSYEGTWEKKGCCEFIAGYDYEYFIPTGGDSPIYGERSQEDYISGEDWLEVYLPDGTFYEFTESESPFKPFSRKATGTWSSGTRDAAFFSEPPEDGDWKEQWDDHWDTYALAQNGSISGIMGGTENIWKADNKNEPA